MDEKEYDYVIIGGGTAGCVLANRLSKDASISVLMLEGGHSDRKSIWTRVPLGTGKMLARNDIIYRYETEPVPELNNRKLFWPRGRMLGGSSSVNGSVFVRGDPKEFDHWAEGLGNTGWSYKDVLPFFVGMETFRGNKSAFRGTEGPLPVSELVESDPLTDAFLEASHSAGIPTTTDYNGAQFEGAARLQYNQLRGRRASTAFAYLWPVKNRPNLTVLTEAPATRIVFNGRRAVGVEYLRGGVQIKVRARREVIVSAGAVDSPKLLELSGVGDASRLSALGIPVVAHLPGVGENLIDHLQIRVTYECTKRITFNDIYTSRIRLAMLGAKYLAKGTGLMATPLTTAHALAKTRDGLARPNIRIQLHHFSSADRTAYGKKFGLDPYPGFLFGIFQLRPESRGWIHIASKDPRDPPAIQPNHLTHAEDIRTYIEAIRLSRRISSQSALTGLIVKETRPGADAISDDELLGYIRECGATSYHPIGTCRMGSDENSVVGQDLLVHGLERLRVVDASIMPTMVSSNTNAASIMIGERGADFIQRTAKGI